MADIISAIPATQLDINFKEVFVMGRTVINFDTVVLLPKALGEFIGLLGRLGAVVRHLGLLLGWNCEGRFEGP